MLVPVEWLREYVEVPEGATGAQIAADLVRVGLEEEGLHTGGVTGPLVVGRVLTRDPEPQKNGKVINWCTVDVGEANGTGEPQGIVCGAHNFEPGELVVVILPGGALSTPDGPFEISARKTYGHVSAGMICSGRELGINDDHDGIVVLDGLLAGDPRLAGLRPGDDAIALLGLDRETVEINVTPDRGYCFSLRGVAREYSNSTGARFTDPVLDLDRRAPAGSADGFAVELRDDAPIGGREGCARYVARIVRDVDVTAPTPPWLATRLVEAGMRPISLPVDVTNYVMLALGQPLHAFDLDALTAPVVVRRARADETLTTLDGVGRTLSAEDLLITDHGGDRAIALAGVMGGDSTEVSGSTRDLLIESAHFDSVTVARSARRHKLASEASRRFERGVDTSLAPAAAQLAVDLLVEHGGGVADSEVTDEGGVPAPTVITMSVDFPSRIVGVDYTPEEVVGSLTAIGAEVDREGETLAVTAPSWRPDLTTAETLVEEVARLNGYDKIPTILPTPPGGSGLTTSQRARRIAADVLVGAGLTEVWSAPFVGPERFRALGLVPQNVESRTVRLANPLSDEQPFMRSLVLSTLVDAVRRNIDRGARDVGLFEIGLVVDRDGPQRVAPTEAVGVRPSDETLAAITAAVPRQPRHLAIVLVGDRERAGWWGAGRRADLSDAIEITRDLASALSASVHVRPDAVAPFHPGRCARIETADGAVIGHVGELHPKVCTALGVPARTIGGELDLDALLAAADRVTVADSLATLPVAHSDVALVVGDEVEAGALEQSLRLGAGSDLESITLFDIYRGDQIGAGKKSLAYRLSFRSPQRTLTTDEVSALRDAAVQRAGAEWGAEQR